MDLCGRPSQLFDQGADLIWFGDLVPGQIVLIGGVFADHEPGRASVHGHAGPAQKTVGVRLQGALGERGPVPVVFESRVQVRLVDDPAGRRDVALLQGQDDVVVQRLGEALDQHVVGGQSGAADPETGLADDVEHVEGHSFPAAAGGNGVQVAGERGKDQVAFVAITAVRLASSAANGASRSTIKSP